MSKMSVNIGLSSACVKTRGQRLEDEFYTNLNTWCILLAAKLYMENWISASGVQTGYAFSHTANAKITCVKNNLPIRKHVKTRATP